MSQLQLQQTDKRTAILVYVYYPDIFKHIVSLLKNLDLTYTDIFLAINNSLDISTIQDICQDIKGSIKNTIFVDNIGVDILPFLLQLKALDAHTYKYFIKLHTKKSTWGSKNNIEWLSVLLHSLIGSDKIYQKNISMLDSKPNIGMIGAKALIMSGREFMHTSKIKELCSILGINYDRVANGKFIGGSIFMARLEPFITHFTEDNIEKLQNLIVSNNEVGSVKDMFSNDGKYCHSIERIFGYIISYLNMKISGYKLTDYRILNKESKKGYFNLVVCYNGLCYLDEDPNCVGQFYRVNNKLCLIEWKHLKNIDCVFQKYIKLDNKTLIKDI